MYLNITWLDISYIVQTMCQFMNEPTKMYENALFKINKFLKKFPSQEIFAHQNKILRS